MRRCAGPTAMPARSHLYVVTRRGLLSAVPRRPARAVASYGPQRWRSCLARLTETCRMGRRVRPTSTRPGGRGSSTRPIRRLANARPGVARPARPDSARWPRPAASHLVRRRAYRRRILSGSGAGAPCSIFTPGCPHVGGRPARSRYVDVLPILSARTRLGTRFPRGLQRSTLSRCLALRPRWTDDRSP